MKTILFCQQNQTSNKSQKSGPQKLFIYSTIEPKSLCIYCCKARAFDLLVFAYFPAVRGAFELCAAVSSLYFSHRRDSLYVLSSSDRNFPTQNGAATARSIFRFSHDYQRFQLIRGRAHTPQMRAPKK